MTDAERKALNERVARKRGWVQIIDKDGPGWLCPGGCIYCSGDGRPHNDPPDFTREWEHAGPLLVELLEWHGHMGFGHEFFHVWLTKGKKHEGKKLTEAITRAWDAWKEGEK